MNSFQNRRSPDSNYTRERGNDFGGGGRDGGNRARSRSRSPRRGPGGGGRPGGGYEGGRGRSNFGSGGTGGGVDFRGGPDRYNDYNRGGGSYYNERDYGGNDRMSNLGADLQAVDYSRETVSVAKFNFYQEHADVQRLTAEEVGGILRSRDLCVKSGTNVPKPIPKFEHANFPVWMMDVIQRSGFSRPSPIQTMAWPIALSGRNMIGIAQTGSGKTLAFILPVLIHIQAQPKLQYGDGPIALIMAPTRELAEQIKQETDKFSASSGVKNAVAYGGVPKRQQIYSLRNGVEILIATPGRLIDFLSSNVTNLKRVTFLVLDEADRMLDMGFEPQIRKVVSQVRPTRQVLMLSATWPKAVERLAMSLMGTDVIHILVGREDLTANEDITQHVMLVNDHEKESKLEGVLRNSNGAKCLVFTDTKKNCDRICHRLRHLGFPALAIHGDKKQEERTWVLEEFRSGSHPILIATDVASRGLDVKDVEMVVNTDMPTDIESYVHRIGRTGRAGAKGDSYTFLTEKDAKIASDLVKILRDANQIIPPEIEDLARRPSFGKGKGRGGGGYMANKPRVGGYGAPYGGGNHGGVPGGNPMYGGAGSSYGNTMTSSYGAYGR